MEKIKSVLHHGHRKSVDATRKDNPSSSAAESNGGPTGQAIPAEEYHPIYDQFSSTSRPNAPNAPGEPTATKGDAGLVSDRSHVSQTQPSQIDTAVGSSDKTLKTPVSSLRPDAAHDRQGLTSEGASAASIKSGVIGFPQGSNDQHAAIGRTKNLEDSLDRNQILGGGGNSTNTTPTKHRESSHVARDAGFATGVAGATGAGTYAATREFNDPQQEGATKEVAEQKPSEAYLPEPSPTTDTDRSFPLIGGVNVTRRPLHKTEINEREPGTKDKEVGVKDGEGTSTSTSTALPHTSERVAEDREVGAKGGHGREGLAGAAALAAATASATRSHTSEPDQDATPRASRIEDTHHPDALAAATAAAATSSGASPSTQAEPSSTTTTYQPGTLIRPSCSKRSNTEGTHLHIPGEFPDPTPAEEPAEPSFSSATDVEPAPEAPHELRHTGTLDHPQPKSAEHSPDRSAAIAGAGAVGAAGVAAYGTHRLSEQPEAEASPYSVTKLDPRVDGRAPPASRVEEEKTQKNQPGRDAVFGAGVGTAAAAGLYSASSPEEEKKEETVPAESTSETQPATIERRDFGEERKEDEHHYGRDAAIVGGVGAAGYGLYEANKHHREHQDTQPTAPLNEQRYDATAPATQDPAPVQPINDTKHHYGRDAAVASGAGTAGHGLYEADKRHREQQDAQPEVPSYNQQYDTPAPVAQDPVTAPAQTHHYGRDAALAGGAGAAGYGIYEATKHHDENPHPQPTSLSEQRYDITSPGAHDPAKTSAHPSSDTTHHYGRDAALSAGAGTAAYGAYEATKQHGEHSNTEPTSFDEQRYSTAAPVNEPAMTSAQPTDETHHYGRDAALAGGAGAAGYGAYETAKHYTKHPSTQPTASMDEQRYDPTAPGAHDPANASAQVGGDKTHHYGRDAAIAGGLGAAGAMTYQGLKGTDNRQPHDVTQQQHVTAPQPTDSGYYPPGQSSQYPAQQTAYPQGQAFQDPNQPSQHHYGRDTAFAAGLAATGAGAYAATRGHQDPQQQPTMPQESYQPTSANPSHQRFDSVQDPNQSHQKRDVAATTAAAAAAGAGGAYAYTHHDAEKDRLAQRASFEQQAHEQLLKDQAKESKHQQKEREKAFRKQEKEMEKQHAKEQKQHNKLVMSEEKRQQREEKEEKKLEKEREKEREREADKDEKEKEKEKKHHLFGFLHRDKDKKTGGDQSPQSSSSSPRLSKDYLKESPRVSRDFAGTEASPVPATKSTPAYREALAPAAVAAEDPTMQQQHRETSPSDSFDAGSGSDSQGLGQSGYSSGKRRNKLHKDPPKGHPAREALQHSEGDMANKRLSSGFHAAPSGGSGSGSGSGSGIIGGGNGYTAYPNTAPMDGQNQNYPGAVQGQSETQQRYY